MFAARRGWFIDSEVSAEIAQSQVLPAVEQFLRASK
jgi:hypothetical protein